MEKSSLGDFIKSFLYFFGKNGPLFTGLIKSNVLMLSQNYFLQLKIHAETKVHATT